MAFVVLCLTVPASGEPVSFRRDIAPILVDNCVSCHGPKKDEGGYRIDTYEQLFGEGDSGVPAITASSLDDSEAYRRIVSEDVDERMPLDSEPLTAAQVALIQRWIEEGATFDGQDAKALLSTIIPPPRHPDPPATYPRPIPVTALAFSADGSQLFVSGYHEVTVWNVSDGQLARRITNVDQRTFGIDLSPDGTLAVAMGAPGRRGEVRRFVAADGTLRDVIASASDVFLDVKYSHDSQRLAAGTADSRIVVLEATTGAEQLTLTSHSDWVTAVAWSPDGSRLASASRDKTSKVVDAQSGELVATYGGHGSTVRGVAFHPDGTEVYSSGADSKIHRWKIEDAKKVAEIAFDGEVFRLAVAGPYLFATSADKTVRQFDAKTHQQIRRYEGHPDWTCAVAYHGATHRVASGSYDGQVRIWDVEAGTQVTDFFAAPGYSAR